MRSIVTNNLLLSICGAKTLKFEDELRYNTITCTPVWFILYTVQLKVDLPWELLLA